MVMDDDVRQALAERSLGIKEEESQRKAEVQKIKRARDIEERTMRVKERELTRQEFGQALGVWGTFRPFFMVLLILIFVIGPASAAFMQVFNSINGIWWILGIVGAIIIWRSVK